MWNRQPSVLALWLLPMQGPTKPITTQEKEYADQLSQIRSKEYLYTRGYVREALAEVWKVPGLEIPLNAPPGKPPKLAKGWGHVSFSHCCDGLLIAWSPKEIGVDLERADRTFKADQLCKRYFSAKENEIFNALTGETLRASVLEQWVNKEAAIKWQRGSLSRDIAKWYFCNKSGLAIHKTLKYKIGFKGFYYLNWYIAIAFDQKIHNHPIIICKK